MEIEKGDRVLILSDEKTRLLAEELLREVRKVSDGVLTLVEDHTERPAKEYPWTLKNYVEMVQPTVTFLMIKILPGELPLRKGFAEHVTSMGARHAHMPGFDERVASVIGDCKNVRELTDWVYERVKNSRVIHVYGEDTDLRVEVGLYRWVKDDGVIKSGEWGNLPPGEVFTTPVNVEGQIKVMEMGDYFIERGIVEETLYIENGKLVDAEGNIGKELVEYVGSCNRVGEFALGTNLYITHPIGNLLADEKMLGVHLAFGDPLGEHTGAEWSCDVHVDVLTTNISVKVDGEWLMKDGTYEKRH